MVKAYGAMTQNIMAVLGPCIRSCCYEVGGEFRGRFPLSVGEKEGKLTFHIVAEAGRQLISAGVRENRIYDSGICTCCAKEEFFSYRREGRVAGRSMAIAEIL
jgi:copper oxidase (laccase) domain-containing protein